MPCPTLHVCDGGASIDTEDDCAFLDPTEMQAFALLGWIVVLVLAGMLAWFAISNWPVFWPLI
jgi:hypothetical protein